MDHLDNAFIRRATRVTSFNLTASDFQTLRYKKEIQHLYQNHMFGDFDPEMALDNLDKNKFNKLVRILKKDDKSQFEKLHNLPLKGVGPSEAVFFLLTKDGKIGGGSSAGVDLIIGTTKYEIKAGKWASKATKDYIGDFKLGGSVPGLARLITDLQQLAYTSGATAMKNDPSISKSKMEHIKSKMPNEYEDIRKRYKKMAYDYYFVGHEVIFVQNESNQPDFGEIISIQKVVQADIEMERLTGGTIKPLIKVR